MSAVVAVNDPIESLLQTCEVSPNFVHVEADVGIDVSVWICNMFTRTCPKAREVDWHSKG